MSSAAVTAMPPVAPRPRSHRKAELSLTEESVGLPSITAGTKSSEMMMMTFDATGAHAAAKNFLRALSAAVMSAVTP